MQIRDAISQDHAAWLRLWNAYNRFYEVMLAPEVSAYTFQRILDPDRPLVGRVAERDGQLIGLSVSVIHEGTWSEMSTLYLEDLFVDPVARGAGIGRALLTDTIEQAKARSCSQLYWHTRADNVAARRLYDTFVAADDFVRYRMKLDAKA